MVVPLGSPQPSYSFPSSSTVPDTENELLKEGLVLHKVGVFRFPPIIFGGAVFSPQYNDSNYLSSLIPLQTVRTALRYGINTFDTSAYYGPSEIVFGSVLESLESEFPRSSYHLMTKCGRYGSRKDAFDYSPRAIRRSVERSLVRLHTSYLDVVYLHDIEFVAENIAPSCSGRHSGALASEAELYGLREGQEAKIWGDGDQRVLEAYWELQKLQAEGIIKHIGITGYPLPTLLRLAILILHNPPYEPVDIILSYCHSNLQNPTLAEFVPAFRMRARVGQLVAASPLNMGLLTPSPPAWHPAPAALKAAAKQASDACATFKATAIAHLEGEQEGWDGGLPNVALGFAMRRSWLFPGRAERDIPDIPVVLGLSTPEEVHESVQIWREIQEARNSVEREGIEQMVIRIFERSGYLGWSWASGE